MQLFSWRRGRSSALASRCGNGSLRCASRSIAGAPPLPFHPPVTLLKPVKDSTPKPAHPSRSWLTQDYPAPIQILFGVASADDPVCSLVGACWPIIRS